MVKKILAVMLTVSLTLGGLTFPAVSAQASVIAESIDETTAESVESADTSVPESIAEDKEASEEAASDESLENPDADSGFEEPLPAESESARPEKEADSGEEREPDAAEDDQADPEAAEDTDSSEAAEPIEGADDEEASEAAETDAAAEGDESTEEDIDAEDAEDAGDESTDEDAVIETLEETINSDVVGTTAPFAEGDYFIFSAIAENVVFDIAGGRLSNGANLQLYKLNKSDAQKFHVVFDADGLATITAVHSGKALDAAGMSTASGTNVRQYTSNGTGAQKWIIKKSVLDGYYTIKASYTELVFDAIGGKTDNGTNIRLYVSNSTKAQQWKFVPAEEVLDETDEDETESIPVISPASLSTGYYKIHMAKTAVRCIEVQNGSFDQDANIAIGPNSQESAQVFYLTNLGAGWYSIESCLTGYAFSAANMNAVSGVNIEQKEKNGDKNQRWYITECGGLYTIASGVNSQYVVDVHGGMVGIGTNIRLYQSNDTLAQKWTFEPVNEPTTILPSGNYMIACASNPTIAVSIPAKAAVKGSNAALANYAANNYQKFIVTSFGDGTYKLIVAGSAMALDVAGGKTSNYANVQQYSYNGTTAQRWKIIGCRGIYKIIGLGSGRALDAASGKICDGTNLQIYTDNGTAAQQFIFVPVTISAESNVSVTTENGITYAVDPATGKKFQIEPEYLNDPRVGVDITEDDFFAAVLYTEAGGQGIDGMMMVAYVIKNRMAKGIAAARTGAYVGYAGTLDIMIYQKEQWQVARTKDNGDPAPLGNVLRDIVNGTADYLTNARTAVAKANNGDDLVLGTIATVYKQTGTNTSSKTTLAAGTHIRASAFDYNSFMTPKSWLKYCPGGARYRTHYGFRSDYMGNNAFLYRGHVFFYDEEVW